MSSNPDQPLHEASARGNADAVRRLLTQGVEVDSLGRNERTALHEAARGGHLGVVQLLLEYGANANALTSDGETPLHMATSFSWGAKPNSRVIHLLIEAGCEIDALDHHNTWTALYGCALLDEGAEVAACLLDHGAAIDKRTGFGQTPLLRAAIHKQEALVTLLLERGADLSLAQNIAKQKGIDVPNLQAR